MAKKTKKKRKEDQIDRKQKKAGLTKAERKQLNGDQLEKAPIRLSKLTKL